MYVKVMVSGQDHRSKNGPKSVFPQCKTSIGHNSASPLLLNIEPRGLRVTYGFFGYGGSNSVIAILVT